MGIFTSVTAILYVVLFFGASIFVHELGHFLAARWRGLKVTRFSIGFGPKIWGWKRGDTEYWISWIPLGGYVALPQLGHMEMIEGKPDLPNQMQPISWLSKVIVLLAGAFFNILFAIALGSLLWILGGRPVIVANNTTQIGFVTETIQFDEETTVANPAFTAGIKTGDIVTAIDGDKVTKWEQILTRIILGSEITDKGTPVSHFTILRGDETLKIPVYPEIGGPQEFRTINLYPASPAIVGSTLENSPADLAGLKEGDKFISMDGLPIISRYQMGTHIRSVDNASIQYEIQRGEEIIDISIQAIRPQLLPEGEAPLMIGVSWAPATEPQKENPFALIKGVVEDTYKTIRGLVSTNSNIGLNDMSGPLGMGRAIYQSAVYVGFSYVLWVVIVINVNLAILNLLPIPVLDGGHILFATLEKLRGRAFPQNLMMNIQGTFVLMFLSLFVYILFFDSKRVVEDITEDTTPPVRTTIVFPTPDEAGVDE